MNSSVAMACEQTETDDGVVLVVDDDRDVRQALAGLFRSIGLATESFASGEELLAHEFPDRPVCIVLDLDEVTAYWLAAGDEQHIDLRAPLLRPAPAVTTPPRWLPSLGRIADPLFSSSANAS